MDSPHRERDPEGSPLLVCALLAANLTERRTAGASPSRRATQDCDRNKAISLGFSRRQDGEAFLTIFYPLFSIRYFSNFFPSACHIGYFSGDN